MEEQANEQAKGDVLMVSMDGGNSRIHSDLKIDPAVASGPFITTLNDIISILIYLGLATTFLGSL